MSKVDDLGKMVANWQCINDNCPGKVSGWSYWDMVIKGNPVCPICDDDMVAILTSAKIKANKKKKIQPENAGCGIYGIQIGN